jgi:hypothetical protein
VPAAGKSDLVKEVKGFLRDSTQEDVGAMNLRAVILVSSLLLLAMPVFAREYTEVIVLKNGDRLTGNIKGSVRMCSTSIWIMWMARSQSNGQKWLTSKANSSSSSKLRMDPCIAARSRILRHL